MKKFFKKVPAIIVVSLIIIITVAFAVVAANSEAIGAWLEYVISNQNGNGNIPNGLIDLNGDGKINILEVIHSHNRLAVTQTLGFTDGIY